MWEGLCFTVCLTPHPKIITANGSGWRRFWCLGDGFLWRKAILMAWLVAWGRVIAGGWRGRYSERGGGLKEEIKTAGDGEEKKNSPAAWQSLSVPRDAWCALTSIRQFSNRMSSHYQRASEGWVEENHLLTHYVRVHERCWGQSFMGH